MLKYIVFVSVFVFVILLALFFVAPASSAETEASFNDAYQAADRARKKAASLGHEWRHTRKLLKRAKAAAKKGDYDKAVRLANQARFEGDAAADQAMSQADLWRDAVPKLKP